jgi:hypothetical protein
VGREETGRTFITTASTLLGGIGKGLGSEDGGSESAGRFCSACIVSAI